MTKTVATWHRLEHLERDKKFIQAIPYLRELRCVEPTPKTPKKHIKTMLGLQVTDSGWLEKPLVRWLDGKTAELELPHWVRVPEGKAA
jgi:hypothetical protein